MKHTRPQPLPKPPSTLSHNLAATTLSTLSSNPKQTYQATTPTSSPSKTNSPANIKGAKRSPKKDSIRA
jgi:hypothetical protein